MRLVSKEMEPCPASSGYSVQTLQFGSHATLLSVRQVAAKENTCSTVPAFSGASLSSVLDELSLLIRGILAFGQQRSLRTIAAGTPFAVRLVRGRVAVGIDCRSGSLGVWAY